MANLGTNTTPPPPPPLTETPPPPSRFRFIEHQKKEACEEYPESQPVNQEQNLHNHEHTRSKHGTIEGSRTTRQEWVASISDK